MKGNLYTARMVSTEPEVVLRDLVADDAHRLAALFQSCYGDSYGAAYFYDPEAVRSKLADATLRSVVAVRGGSLVGHMGITVRHPGSLVCETGNTVVHPGARGQGLLMRLALALQERVLREGFRGYVHYPTTAHDIMQRASVMRGGKETGVMLAYVGADTEYEGLERKGGRLAATVVYQPLAPLIERNATLPHRYRALISEIYEDVGLKRYDAPNGEDVPWAERCRIDAHYNERRDTLHMFLAEPGSDVGDAFSRLAARHTPCVSFIDLPLDNPRIDDAIDALRQHGFRYSALLPEFAQIDVLRMQALHVPRDEDFNPNVVNPDAQRFCEFIRNDG